jgi:hypothetical protein
MITTAIIALFRYFITLLLALLPTSSGIPSGFANGLILFISKAEEWNMLIPVNQLFVILGLVFAFEAGIFSFRAIDWLYTKFRGGSHASGAK